ncbi:MAG TPA: hypothetical protein VMO88_01605, partial [Acidimicrobiales bacterium]|nr:hypothetical protein [Acidimicrobiales bacterium]
GIAVASGPAVADSSGSFPPAPFEVGAGQTDITPPSLATPLGRMLDDADFVPVCAPSAAALAQLWPGRRLFAFEKPYVDLFGAHEYVPGDPYCDADAAHRYEAPYIAGGSGVNHWPLTSADTTPGFNAPGTTPTNPAFKDDPVSAQAVVYSVGGRRAAMVTVNSIGLFDTTMDQIRAAVSRDDPQLNSRAIFISSTHDESAPDPIGLWGPDLSGAPSPVNQLNGQLPAGVTSGVDEYYMSFLVQRVAGAIVAADRARQPATLRLSVAQMPSNVQSCWSSYPYIDTGLVPVVQATATSGSDRGHVIFTMADVGTHDETLSFSGNPAYTSMLSGDWTGRLSAWLEGDYPGSVGMEMAGLVGSVETPALYPDGTQVRSVPGAFHPVPGRPVDGCSSVYPEPGAGAAPVTDALVFVDAYARSVAASVVAALNGDAVTVEVPQALTTQSQDVCVQLENNFFLAAFAAGLFPDRPAYADPGCSVGVSLSGGITAGSGSQPAGVRPAAPAFLRSEVGVLTVGSMQIAYSPGEVFPVTEVGGPYDSAQMPFPTDCYVPPSNYTCGQPLPGTSDVAAEMTEPYRFSAGLGEDMIGYLFPPSNFVGSQGEVLEPPWSVYEDTSGTGHDRFGYGHADDSESVGPYAALAVDRALSALLSQDGQGTTVVPGMYLDAGGRLCDSPFPATGSWITGCGAFSGAVGVEVVQPGGAKQQILVGSGSGGGSRWATYLATPDLGTAGTAYSYSTSTRGVITGGRVLLLDVIAGAKLLA